MVTFGNILDQLFEAFSSTLESGIFIPYNYLEEDELVKFSQHEIF